MDENTWFCAKHRTYWTKMLSFDRKILFKSKYLLSKRNSCFHQKWSPTFCAGNRDILMKMFEKCWISPKIIISSHFESKFYHELSIIDRKCPVSNKNSMIFYPKMVNFGHMAIFRVSFVYVHWSSFYESFPF